MSIIMFLSNREIQIVEKKGSKRQAGVKRVMQFSAPEGSLINGVIVEPELFSSFLKELWQRQGFLSKKVELITGSTKIMGKMLDVPRMNRQDILNYLKRELSESSEEEAFVYHYCDVEKEENGRRKIFGERISSALIEEYMEVFAGAQLEIKAVYSDMSSLLKLTRQEFSMDQTFVLQIVHDITLTTILYVDGVFTYYTNARLFQEIGSRACADELAQSVSKIIQFMKANHMEAALEKVIFLGIDEEGFSYCREALDEQGIEIEILMPPDGWLGGNGKEYAQFTHVLAGLYQSDSNDNIIKQYRRSNKLQYEILHEYKKQSIVIAGVLCVMLALWFGVSCYLAKLGRELENVTCYNQDFEVLDSVKENASLRDEILYLEQQQEALDMINGAIVEYPVCNSDTLEMLKECAKGHAKIEFQAYDGDAGIVYLFASAKSVESIHKFIQKLDKREGIDEVNYTGYTYNNQTRLWDIHVNCRLAAQGTKVPEK